MKHISSALLEAQKKIKNALKDAKNPHFKNNYATLESVIDAVKDTANECGVLIVQSNGKDELGHFTCTQLTHAESGESLSSKTYLLIDKITMQGLGSAITYARRYDLAAMFCITQADDDANEASQPVKTVKSITVNSQKNETINLNSDPSYVCTFGKKYNGKTLAEIGIDNVKSYCEYLINGSKESGNPLSGKFLEFVIEGEKYISPLKFNLK